MAKKGTPVSDRERKQIIEAIKAGMSCYQIAKDFERAPATISKLANKEGLSHHFGVSLPLQKAHKASLQSMAESRAFLAERFLNEAHSMLDKLHEPHTAYSFGGKDNVYNEHVFDEPPPNEKKHLMTTAAIAADKHLKLVAHDRANGSETVGSLLGTMIDEMVLKHGVRPEPLPETDTE